MLVAPRHGFLYKSSHDELIDHASREDFAPRLRLALGYALATRQMPLLHCNRLHTLGVRPTVRNSAAPTAAPTLTFSPQARHPGLTRSTASAPP